MLIKRKRGFSIKYKLLALLVLLPVLTLAVYLTLCVRLFEADKIAYVYDSSAAVSRTLASQTLTEIRSFATILKPILRGYQPSLRQFDAAATLQFNSDPMIKAILIRDKNSPSTGADLKKDGIAIDEGVVSSLVKSACENGFAFQTGKTDSEMIAGRFYLGSCENQIPIVAMGESQDLLKAFGKKSVYTNYLVDATGVQIIGPPLNEAIDPNKWPFISSLMNSKLSERTLEVTTPSGGVLIVSASRVGLGDLLVLSLVPKATALSAVSVLLWKSLLFLICIVAGAIIISLFGSRKLTQTLIDLDGATAQVAEGNFNIKVNVRSNDEVGNLATHFNQMAGEVSRLMDVNLLALEELQKAHLALEDYSKNLEKKVEERTVEIRRISKLLRAILDSLGQGFLIFNRDGICQEVYSKACVDTLEANPANQPLEKILKIPEGEIRGFQKWVAALFDEVISFEDLLQLAPTLYLHSKGKQIALEFYPMRNESSMIEGVVLVATDQTREHEAQVEAQKERDYVRRVVRIIKSKPQFLSFVGETLEMISHLKSGKLSRDASLRAMHTIKGGAGTFGLHEVQKLAHELEEQLSQDTQSENAQINFEGLENELRLFFENNREIIGRDLSDLNRRIDLSANSLLKFYMDLMRANASDPLVGRFRDEFLKQSVKTSFSHVDDLLQEIARDENKKMKSAVITGGELRVGVDQYRDLFSSFVHIFRNVVDHGIETPENRREFGKDEAGQLSLSFSIEQMGEHSQLRVQINDDGQGIDPARIRAKLKGQGKELIAETETDEQVIQHIFDPAFSTREQVTELSGRGIGMDAVAVAAQDLGGSATVSSTLGVGTQITILVPDQFLAGLSF